MAEEIIGGEAAPRQKKKRIWTDKDRAYWVAANKRKQQILGMPLGTAMARLRKGLMFDLACKTGDDVCFRCGLKIEAVEEFSIEHKDSWQLSADPQSTFFNKDNIAFSHYACNLAAARKLNKRFASVAEKSRFHAKKNQAKMVIAKRERRARRRAAGLPYT